MTDLKLLQFAKTRVSIDVTPLPMVTEAMLVHAWYLEVIDSQLFAVNTVEKWIGFYLWVYGK